METSIKILLLEDSIEDSELLVRHLKREHVDFTYRIVQNKSGFEEALGVFPPDLIIADYSLPQFSGMEAFRMVKKQHLNIPFILVTGTISEKRLIEFAREGIDDYILKDNLLRLSISIENVVNKKRIERLHSELEVAHKDIQDSINYAKLIQDALLPEEDTLQSSFPDSFILFRPKAILSGDFYWFKKLDGILFIAAVDCTGHGVPGSLLSMMGLNILDEVVSSPRVWPALVLKSLSRQFVKIIHNKQGPFNDGMDIAFCAINTENRVLTFAGGNRPLYLLREHLLIEYKPDRMSIGDTESTLKSFTDNSVPLQSGDRIFLFTDGFTDQFHEETDKKMTARRLQEVLISTSFLPFAEQEYEIIHFFESWMGNREQTDDVLMIGVEIP